METGVKSQSAVAKPPLANEAKPGKGQFKCFQCRKIFASKDGDWFSWNTMEVHLCRSCDKATQSRSERKKKN